MKRLQADVGGDYRKLTFHEKENSQIYTVADKSNEPIHSMNFRKDS